MEKLHKKVLGSITVAEMIEVYKEPGQPLLLNPINIQGKEKSERISIINTLEAIASGQLSREI